MSLGSVRAGTAKLCCGCERCGVQSAPLKPGLATKGTTKPRASQLKWIYCTSLSCFRTGTGWIQNLVRGAAKQLAWPLGWEMRLVHTSEIPSPLQWASSHWMWVLLNWGWGQAASRAWFVLPSLHTAGMWSKQDFTIGSFPNQNFPCQGLCASLGCRSLGCVEFGPLLQSIGTGILLLASGGCHQQEICSAFNIHPIGLRSVPKPPLIPCKNQIY